MSKIKWIEEEHDFDSILSNQKRSVVLKHSFRCPISSRALYEFEKAVDRVKSDTSWYAIDIISFRKLSNYIETELNIRHESPQLFLIENGKVKSSTSHFNITADFIESQLAK